MELIPKNPLSGVGTFREPNFEKPEEKLHYYTAEQYHRFIAEAKKDEYRRYYVFFSIEFYTGMRKGEINALTRGSAFRRSRAGRTGNRMAFSYSFLEKKTGEHFCLPVSL